MKTCFLLTCLLFLLIPAKGQFKAFKSAVGGLTGKLSETVDGANGLDLRGPAKPMNPAYADYKTYSLTNTLSPQVETTIRGRSRPYSKTELDAALLLRGLTKTQDGAFKIAYNVTRFELPNDDDFFKQTTYQKAPAYFIGMESNLVIQDNTGKEIYRRYFIPTVRMFVTDPEYPYEKLVQQLLADNFNALIAEFSAFYLYGPVLGDLRYFKAEKGRKSKSAFNADEFNQSVEVFPTLINVDRANWPSLFGEAQTYWKSLVAYSDPKDEDVQKSVRFAANYNLAATYLLLGQEQDAATYLGGIRENERSFLGIRSHHPFMVEMLEQLKVYRNAADRITTINPIAAEPDLPAYKKTATAFQYAELEGEVVEDDAKIHKGKIRVISDYPELVDYRTEQSSTALGQLLNQLGSDNSSVRIFVEGQKKPVKSTLKKVALIRDNQGHTYIVGKTGQGFKAIGQNLTSTKRYALFEEVKTANDMGLFHEYFPQQTYSLKRTGEEDFYVPPVFVGRRKSLLAFFADCPVVQARIEKGDYDTDSKEVYQQLFADYVGSCGKK